MCVEILLDSVTLFKFEFTDHVIAANCPYDEIPVIFKRGNPFSGQSYIYVGSSGKQSLYRINSINQRVLSVICSNV